MALLRRFAFALIVILGLAPQVATAQQTEILINGQPLTLEEIAYYGVDLPSGSYWYDQAPTWSAASRASRPRSI